MKSEAIFDLVNKGVNEVFGDIVTYDAVGVLSNPVGTFTDESLVVGGDGGVISSSPFIMIRKADLAFGLIPKVGHKITINSQVYEVWEVKRDDSGAWLLALKLSA